MIGTNCACGRRRAAVAAVVAQMKTVRAAYYIVSCRGHSSNTRARWRIVSRMRGRRLMALWKTSRALSRLLPASMEIKRAGGGWVHRNYLAR